MSEEEVVEAAETAQEAVQKVDVRNLVAIASNAGSGVLALTAAFCSGVIALKKFRDTYDATIALKQFHDVSEGVSA